MDRNHNKITWPKNKILQHIIWWPFSVNKDYVPWWLLSWRIFWYIPMQVFRFMYLSCCLFGWGPKIAKRMFEDTR
jgi:hypothetical protein